MPLIDSDMFYWRQKKCFSVIDKVKNVTTLIIYSSVWQNPPKPKPFTSFIGCNRKGKKKKKKQRLSDSPLRLTGRSVRFQFPDKGVLCVQIRRKQRRHPTALGWQGTSTAAPRCPRGPRRPGPHCAPLGAAQSPVGALCAPSTDLHTCPEKPCRSWGVTGRWAPTFLSVLPLAQETLDLQTPGAPHPSLLALV